MPVIFLAAVCLNLLALSSNLWALLTLKPVVLWRTEIEDRVDYVEVERGTQ